LGSIFYFILKKIKTIFFFVKKVIGLISQLN